MNYVREFILLFWKFVSWTPADLLYTTNTISSNVYTSFHGKIVWSNLKLLFINIIQIGVLLDVLFLFNMLRPSWKTTTLPYSRIIGFTFLSVLNVVHHLVFLLLRNKKKYQQISKLDQCCFVRYSVLSSFPISSNLPSQSARGGLGCVWSASDGCGDVLLSRVIRLLCCGLDYKCTLDHWWHGSIWSTGKHTIPAVN